MIDVFKRSVHLVSSLLRLIFAVAAKFLLRLIYRYRVRWITPIEASRWSEIRLALLLNHTSLFEPLYAGALPLRYLTKLSFCGSFPGADVTLQRPYVGALVKFLAPKVFVLTRRRDQSWNNFIASIEAKDSLIFLPEGRMKRPDGLDKFGKPMTVKTGVVDLLTALQSGWMLIAYSGGLHHVQAPGQGLPRIFKELSIAFELVRIEDYLASFDKAEDVTAAIVSDLEQRRDRYCIL